MAKINNPQIYVFNNHEIAEALSDDFVVDEGDLGSVVVAEFPQRVNEIRFNPGFSYAKNLHEYKIWVQDFQNKFPEKHIDKGDEPCGKREMIRIEYPINRIVEAPLAINDMKSMLSDATLRIVFAISNISEDYERCMATGKDFYRNLYSERIGLYDTFSAIPISQQGQLFRPEDTVFGELIDKYCEGYAVTFELPSYFDQRIGQIVSDSKYISLATSKDGKVISYLGYRKNMGYELVLPLCRNRDQVVYKIITEILPQILPNIVPESKEFSWLADDRYKSREELLIDEKKKQLQEKYESDLMALEEELVEAQETNRFLRNMLIGTGDDLVSSVCEYLRWLGFENVEEIDGSEDIKREDIQVEDGNDMYIIEVKGIGGTSTDSECSQVAKHRRRREKENHDKTIHPIYIVNHQRYIKPELRENPPFTTYQIEYAVSDERGLLTTWQLYQQYEFIEKGIFTKEDTRESLKKDGLIDLIPNGLKLLGEVTEYFKKPNACILNIERKISQGDVVLCSKDGEWRKGIVQSIQIDDVEVDFAEIGEVGLVLDISLAKGFKVYIYDNE